MHENKKNLSHVRRVIFFSPPPEKLFLCMLQNRYHNLILSSSDSLPKTYNFLLRLKIQSISFASFLLLFNMLSNACFRQMIFLFFFRNGRKERNGERLLLYSQVSCCDKSSSKTRTIKLQNAFSLVVYSYYTLFRNMML